MKETKTPKDIALLLCNELGRNGHWDAVDALGNASRWSRNDWHALHVLSGLAERWPLLVAEAVRASQNAPKIG